MPFNRVIESLDIIQKLSDLPNEDDNLTADELKAKFDKGVNILKEYVFSFIDEIEGIEAASKIGYDGAHPSVGEALKALESAGVGTVPPDNTITNAKLQDESVSESKLDLELANKVNATKVKFGTITPTYTGDTTIDNGISGYVTADKWQEFDLGFEPSIVMLFKYGQINSRGIEFSSNRNLYLYGIAMGDTFRVTRREEFTRYGGIATKELPCKINDVEIFKIDGNKIKTHLYTYSNTNNSDVDKYYIGTKETLYYIAVA